MIHSSLTSPFVYWHIFLFNSMVILYRRGLENRRERERVRARARERDRERAEKCGIERQRDKKMAIRRRVRDEKSGCDMKEEG